MRLKPILFFLIVGSIAGYFVYSEATRVGQPGVINIGEVAPDFTIGDENGKEVKLSDYRGKLVFLNFWATWCEPCIEEMPDMEVLYKTFKGKNFQMLAVSLDLDWDTVKDFYRKHNLTLPSFSDPGRQVASKYKVYKYPETFLIDEKGFVIKHYVGAEKWTNPQVMTSIADRIPPVQQSQN